MRLLYLFLLPMLLCCTCIAGAQETSPPGPQALSKPVTLAVKGEALSDIMQTLSKQTGLKLRATKEVADQKATIFVDGKPLKYVLDSLATIFGYRLSVVRQSDGSKVYELWESPKTRLARESATSGAVEAAWREMDRRIRQVAQSTLDKQEKCRLEYQQIMSQAEQRQSITPEELERIRALQTQFGPAVPMARLYASLATDTIEAFRAGASIYFDTDAHENQWRVPPDIDADLMARVTESDAKYWPGRPPTGYNIEFRTSATDSAISFSCQCTGGWPSEDGGPGRWVTTGGSPCPEVIIGDVAPDQQIKLQRISDEGALCKQVVFTVKELVDEAALYWQPEGRLVFVNRSDVLALLHRKTGLQSISDHHSYWFTWDAQGPQTVKDLLTQLPEMIARTDRKAKAEDQPGSGDPKSEPVWGWDGACLQLRERFPYKLDAMEPPSRTVQRLRTNLARNRYLDLEDIAEMAALSDGQSSVLSKNWDRLVKVKGLDYRNSDFRNISSAHNRAAMLYAHLTDVQKRAMRSSGLRVADLMPSQLDELAKCVSSLLQEHPKDGDQAIRRVGIYRNGIRLDRPEPGAVMSAVIKLDRRESVNYTLTVPIAENQYTGAEPKAQSADDAWQQCLKRFPDLDKRPHFFGRNMGYTMIFLFPDGTTKEYPIELYVPVRVGG